MKKWALIFAWIHIIFAVMEIVAVILVREYRGFASAVIMLVLNVLVIVAQRNRQPGLYLPYLILGVSFWWACKKCWGYISESDPDFYHPIQKVPMQIKYFRNHAFLKKSILKWTCECDFRFDPIPSHRSNFEKFFVLS